MDLCTLPIGTTARIDAVDITGTSRLRLRELGLRTGTLVRVTHRGLFGGRVISAGPDAAALTSRIGIDGHTARLIAVTPLLAVA